MMKNKIYGVLFCVFLIYSLFDIKNQKKKYKSVKVKNKNSLKYLKEKKIYQTELGIIYIGAILLLRMIYDFFFNGSLFYFFK